MRTAGLVAGGAALATGAVALGAAWAVRGRSSAVFGPSLHRGPRGRREIALTFDDGPGKGTLQLLKILGEYGAPATFFQCGVNVQRNPEACLAVRESGHEIGNHSQTHPMCALQRPSFIADEFTRAQETISAAAGVAPVLMRAPFGVRWFGFRAMQSRLGLTGVMWTVIGRDWTLNGPAIAERVLSSGLSGNLDGGIVCLHDGRGTKADPSIEPTLEAVRRILPALLERGFRFKTVSDLCLNDL
jgi:peptidoglycan/xylan/chitin deacetylase (PgdA/CDA1 family)